MATTSATAAFVSASVSDGVMEIRLTRPEKLNALVGDTFDSLTVHATRAGLDKGVRAVLLTAEGRAFSVGDDLNGQGERFGVAQSDVTEAYASYTQVVATLIRLRKPTVVALRGPAYGGGLEIALACDFRYAAPDVTLGPVYANLGYAAGTTLLPLYVGHASARRILLLGDPLDAESALEFGLLDSVSDEYEEQARELAARLAAGPTLAYGYIKTALLIGAGQSPLEALHLEEDISLATIRSEDAEEAAAAFKEKRPPQFRGA